MVFAVPAVLLVAAQTLFLVYGPMPTGRSGFEIAPFVTVEKAGISADPVFWLLPLVVLATVPLLWRRLRDDTCFGLSAMTIVVAVPAMLLFRETGPRENDFALLKLGYTAGMLVSVFWLRAVFAELRHGMASIRDRSANGPTRTGALVLAGVVAVLVVSGVLAYLQGLGAVATPPH